MHARSQIMQIINGKNSPRAGANIAMVILLLHIFSQLFSLIQAQDIVNPLIPASIMLEMNKQFIFHILVASGISIISLFFYFFRKYLIIMILILLTFIVDRYIYL